MSLKKQAAAALTTLTTAIAQLPPETRRDALAAHQIVERFIGELRQDRSTLKTEAEAADARAAPLADKCRELEQQLTATKEAMQSLEQRLQAQLTNARRELAALQSQNQLDRLIPGPKQPVTSAAEHDSRRRLMLRLVPQYLPDFARSLDAPLDVITIHQDAFASGFHADEYTLLGMCIKFAGETGRTVMIIGKNGETLRPGPEDN